MSREVTLCVTDLYGHSKSPYPVELKFPPELKKEEKERIDAALERTVRELGYEPSWIPVL